MDLGLATGVNSASLKLGMMEGGSAMSTKRFDPKIFLEAVGDGKMISHHRAGEIIFKQGSPALHVFYLRSGKAKETVASEHGKDAMVGMLEPGIFFGTGSLDGGRHRVSTVTAMTPCTVTAITRDAMLAALREPSFAQMFMTYLLDQNTRIEAEKVDLLFNSSEKRLAQRLLILARFGEGRPRIIGPEITQEMLADMIGTTRPRVNYFLNRFRKMGHIRYNGGIEVQASLLNVLVQDLSHTDKPERRA